MINDRAQHLLKAVVERYIRDGQPVGSKTLAEETAIGLSSATIRNILAELEERGYLRSPYTSAGRIPTAQGYRFFVNALLTTQPLATSEVQQMTRPFSPDLNVPELVSSASNMLSELTQMMGLVMLPKRDQQLLRHVEFLPLADNRILVILVINDREVQNRIIYADRTYSASELQQAANYLNETYSGRDVLHVRKDLLAALQTERQSLDQLMHAAIEVADKAFDQPVGSKDYVLAGQNHLFELADVSSMSRIRQLFEVFTQKQDILHLLDQCLNADGVQIFIGEESGYDLLDECSVVTAPYSVNDQVVGVLGVIGPTRMSYDRVIPVVDVTAKLLSAALNPSW